MFRKINMAPHAAGDEASFKFGGAANLGRQPPQLTASYYSVERMAFFQ